MSNSFVTFDFETANSARASACEIVLVKVVDGTIVDTFQSFIKPPPGHDHFDSFNIRLHGITPEHVADAPRFPAVWGQVAEFKEDLPLVAHNAAFDVSVIRAAAAAEDFDNPYFRYYCTLILSRRVLQLDSYKLKNVAKELGVEFTKEHHKAVNDAEACANVALAMAALKNVPDLKALAKSVRVQPKENIVRERNEWSSDYVVEVPSKTLRKSKPQNRGRVVMRPAEYEPGHWAPQNTAGSQKQSRVKGGRAKKWGFGIGIFALLASMSNIGVAWPWVLISAFLNLVAFGGDASNKPLAKAGLIINGISILLGLIVLAVHGITGT